MSAVQTINVLRELKTSLETQAVDADAQVGYHSERRLEQLQEAAAFRTQAAQMAKAIDTLEALEASGIIMKPKRKPELLEGDDPL
ncbi:hypothetical protein [Bradyrhizobium sp. Ec3.3]|uniref:hypothetical protein n=1 Tax=Bradyrhizobium sp. Ec3.3 TaxID=189753 RepID=UPI000418B784|nr:hypothetical protein [Bradyrhizobium sp. Ec3.3]